MKRTGIVWGAAAAVVLVSLATQANAAGDAKIGAVLFNRCVICHSTTKGAASRMGPNLFGVVGRKAGTYPGFVYSQALKKAGFVWTVPKLETWLADPQKLVPGNNMPIAGIADAKQRADLAAYLATLK
ncbi:MAG: c-type cytochrome [Rhizomicrobium sp.]